MGRFRSTLDRLRRWGEDKVNAAPAPSSAAPPSAEDAAVFLADVLTRFPYTDEARRWLSTQIAFEVIDLQSTRGGGFWIPDQNKVQLFTAQYEAAIHELAHAWWHTRRIGQEEAMMQTTITLSNETDPRYARMARLAHGYIHGIPEQGWAGMLVERNDWEMYAGLASGMMADMRQIPPYVRSFYDAMYALLPDNAPSPAALAPHG
jgi:hypothetical protein